MTRAEIIAVAQWCGIPYVELSEPYPGTVDILADRPRNVPPCVWRSWCFIFTCWLDMHVPLWVYVVFRTEGTILPIGWAP